MKHSYFNIVKRGDRYIIARKDGSQWTTNSFTSYENALNFLVKVSNHAKELMETHKRLKGKELN